MYAEPEKAQIEGIKIGFTVGIPISKFNSIYFFFANLQNPMSLSCSVAIYISHNHQNSNVITKIGIKNDLFLPIIFYEDVFI